MTDFRLPASFSDAASFEARLKEIDSSLGCDPEPLDASGPMG